MTRADHLFIIWFTGDEQVSDGSAVPICVLSMNLYRLSNNKREKINYTSLVLLE